MDFDDIIVALTEVVALLVVVENWFCPFGVEKTTVLLKTLLEAAEKAVFFIVVFALKEEEEETEEDEIAWFIVVCISSVFWRKFLCGSRKKLFKKKNARFLRDLEQVSSERFS